MSPLIELKDVSFSYGGKPVLDHINLQINKGEYVGVIGPNGGGKTTALKLMLGLLPAPSGEVRLFDKPVKAFTHWERIGYVPQHAAMQKSRLPITAEEVVRMGRVGKLGLFTFAGRKDAKAVAAAMEKVDILPLRRQLLSELSGGQQQRVFIAKALASEPELLILDEPTTGIDVKSQDTFYQLLAKLNEEEKLTLVMVSHDIDVVVNEVTKIACINQTLIYHGEPEQFIKGDHLSKLYGKARRFILHGH